MYNKSVFLSNQNESGNGPLIQSEWADNRAITIKQ